MRLPPSPVPGEPVRSWEGGFFEPRVRLIYNQIKSHLDHDTFWIGVNDQVTEGRFVSIKTGLTGVTGMLVTGMSSTPLRAG